MTHRERILAEIGNPSTNPLRVEWLKSTLDKTYWTASYECILTVEGWGKKGNTQSIANIQAITELEAIIRARKLMPRNWNCVSVAKQDHCHDGVCGCCD